MCLLAGINLYRVKGIHVRAVDCLRADYMLTTFSPFEIWSSSVDTTFCESSFVSLPHRHVLMSYGHAIIKTFLLLLIRSL